VARSRDGSASFSRAIALISFAPTGPCPARTVTAPVSTPGAATGPAEMPDRSSHCLAGRLSCAGQRGCRSRPSTPVRIAANDSPTTGIIFGQSAASRDVAPDPHDIADARFGKRRLECCAMPLCLVGRVLDDGHGCLVEAGGARDEHPLAIGNRPAVAAAASSGEISRRMSSNLPILDRGSYQHPGFAQTLSLNVLGGQYRR